MSENLLNILPELQVTSEEQREAEVFAQQYLSALYPTVDFRPGLATYDQVIRPSASLLALLNKGMQFYFANNTVADVTESTPEEFVDKLMSNYFLSRRIGKSSKVVARLFFLEKKGTFVSTSYYFSPNNEQLYYPLNNTSFTADQMQASASTDALGPYYLDVELEAEAPGEDYNLESGSLLFFTNFDPFFVGGSILYLKDSTITRETNTEFVQRTESSVSTRNLINDPSISERMLSLFTYVSHCQPIGHDDPEMIRDIRTVVNPVSGIQSNIHLGGTADVYVDSPIVLEASVPVKVENVGGVLGFYLRGPYIEYDTTAFPASEESDVTPANGYVTPVTGGIPSWSKSMPSMTIQGYDATGRVEGGDYRKDTGFSTEQVSFVEVPANISMLDESGNIVGSRTLAVGSYFYVNAYKFLGLESIQNYLDSKDTRVIVADYMARAMDVYHLSFHVNSLSTTDVLTPEQLRPAIESYVQSIAPGDPFVMSDLIYAIKDVSGVIDISTPVEVTYTRYTRNGKTELGGAITDVKDVDRLSRFEIKAVTTGFTPVNTVHIGAPILTGGTP